jgi:paraquat-inducible protein A
MNANQIACRICGLVHVDRNLEPGNVAECARCGHMLSRRTPHSLQITAAFALSALFFYAPANLFPILHMSMFGTITENTIFTGVIRFYQDGDYFVAIIVFLASILIPFLKILGLIFLVVSTHFRWPKARIFRTKLLLTVESLGRWAMLDVFALAVLVSLLKMGRIATVVAGKGAIAFVFVIIFTILASASFDSHLIWEEKEKP